MCTEIRVFYLARLSDGFEKIKKFAESYQNFRSGEEHVMTVIVKGSRNQFETDLIMSLFSEIDCNFELLPDYIGVDIHAYLLMSAKYQNQYFCFFNTHSEIVSENWLAKLSHAIRQENVGLAGAFGSFESIYSSWEIIYRAQQKLRRGELNFRNTRNFRWILGTNRIPGTFWAIWTYKRINHFGKRILLRILLLDKSTYSDYYEWRKVTKAGATLSFVNKFDRFPNPHIRSNAFIIRKSDIEVFQNMPEKEKLAANEFECGKEGLSQYFISRSKRLVVVGKSGELFDVKEWENSETFRLGSQSNLLIRDNQTRNFENMTHGTKKVHQALTWGSELVSDKPDITLGQSLRHIENTSTPVNSGKKYRISVVIPSHNRNELVDQALFSIISQSYPFIEVIVFDNASKLPLSESSRYSKNKAIKFHRSDVFLSVTESWNRAISYATGEYLIFLGDDDGLLPGFFKTINNLIVNFDCPDFIVSSLYQFFHPEVLPSHPQGLLSFMEIAPCMGQNATPYLVSPDNAKNFVLSSLNLQRLFLFQMPGYVVRREFLLEHRSQERIFEPPFPDYFLTNFIFWKAKKIVANPNPISFQGVSKKSFGYTLVNGITQNGFKTLNESVSNDKSRVSELLLPGSQYWNSYLLTMEKLASCLEISFKLDSIKRYRKIRIVQEIVEIQSTISRRKLGQLYFEFKIRANFFNNLTRKEHLFTALAFGVLGLKKIKKFKISNISELFLLKWSPNYYVLEQFPIKSSELLDNKDLFVFLRDSL